MSYPPQGPVGPGPDGRNTGGPPPFGNQPPPGPQPPYDEEPRYPGQPYPGPLYPGQLPPPAPQPPPGSPYPGAQNPGPQYPGAQYPGPAQPWQGPHPTQFLPPGPPGPPPRRRGVVVALVAAGVALAAVLGVGIWAIVGATTPVPVPRAEAAPTPSAPAPPTRTVAPLPPGGSEYGDSDPELEAVAKQYTDALNARDATADRALSCDHTQTLTFALLSDSSGQVTIDDVSAFGTLGQATLHAPGGSPVDGQPLLFTNDSARWCVAL